MKSVCLTPDTYKQYDITYIYIYVSLNVHLQCVRSRLMYRGRNHKTAVAAIVPGR